MRTDRELAEHLLGLACELYDKAGNDDSQSPKIAAMFCNMSDDGQAVFFEHVARIMKGWPGPAAGMMQIEYIAGHMRACECVTDAGRDWVRELAERLTEVAA